MVHNFILPFAILPLVVDNWKTGVFNLTIWYTETLKKPWKNEILYITQTIDVFGEKHWKRNTSIKFIWNFDSNNNLHIP